MENELFEEICEEETHEEGELTLKWTHPASVTCTYQYITARCYEYSPLDRLDALLEELIHSKSTCCF